MGRRLRSRDAPTVHSRPTGAVRQSGAGRSCWSSISTSTWRGRRTGRLDAWDAGPAWERLTRRVRWLCSRRSIWAVGSDQSASSTPSSGAHPAASSPSVASRWIASFGVVSSAWGCGRTMPCERVRSMRPVVRAACCRRRPVTVRSLRMAGSEPVRGPHIVGGLAGEERCPGAAYCPRTRWCCRPLRRPRCRMVDCGRVACRRPAGGLATQPSAQCLVDPSSNRNGSYPTVIE